MNITVVSLSLTRVLGTPLLGQGINKERSYLNCNNVHISKSASHFIYTSLFKKSLKITNSRFEKFLATPVKANAINISDLTITTGYKYIDKENITFNQCIFKYCTTNKRGGAISVAMPFDYVPDMDLNNIAFIHCKANRGGAIFTSRANAKLYRCCFSNCSATQIAHAFLIYTNGAQMNEVEACSFYQCPGKVSSAPYVAHLANGLNKFNGINGSSNCIRASSCWISTENASYLIINYMNFRKCEGKNGLYYKHTRSSTISNALLFNNTVDTPIKVDEIITETSIIIQESTIFFNKFKTKSNRIGNDLQSGVARIEIRMSAVEEDFFNTLDGFSQVITPSARPRGVGQTQYFATHACIITAPPEDDGSREKFLNEVMWLCIGVGAVVIFLLSVGIIVFGTLKRRAEDRWLTQQDSSVAE